MLDEKLLEETQEAVDKYTPILSERLGIKLPEIAVVPRDYNEFSFSTPFGIRYCPFQQTNTGPYEDPRIETFTLPRIYVSSNIRSIHRMLSGNTEEKDPYVDSRVVHELAQYAWDVVAGKFKIEDANSIEETVRAGYAGYIQRYVFADVLAGCKVAHNPDLGTEVGIKMVHFIAEKRGKGVLTELPLAHRNLTRKYLDDLVAIVSRERKHSSRLSKAIVVIGAVLLATGVSVNYPEAAQNIFLLSGGMSAYFGMKDYFSNNSFHEDIIDDLKTGPSLF